MRRRSASQIVTVGEDEYLQSVDVLAQAAAAAGPFKPILCPTCEAPRGCELVFPLATAAELVPFESLGAARKWLSLNQRLISQPLHKKIGARWYRYLSTTDICTIRRVMFHPFATGRMPKAPEAQLIRLAGRLESAAQAARLRAVESETPPAVRKREADELLRKILIDAEAEE